MNRRNFLKYVITVVGACYIPLSHKVKGKEKKLTLEELRRVARILKRNSAKYDGNLYCI
jgi:hypothetical protein